MSLQLLVDSTAFWAQLQSDIAAAESRVWLQTLSLEADGAGLPLADALLDCGARDCRLLVDAFSEHILSDRFIYSPANMLRAELRAEVAATRAMHTRLKHGGMRIGITNPAGLLWHRLPSRDHRKLILIDSRIAYIGGINFSDHNFAWHDLMIRIDDEEITRFLEADFDATWKNSPVHSNREFDGIELHCLSGHGNEPKCAPVLDVIRGASRSILAITPYLTFPFTDAMADARANGAEVTVLTPAINNRKSHQQYVLWLARTHGFTLHHYLGRMSHLKAMLIDGDTLIVGSSNFDWPTYHNLAEVIAIITDPVLIADFRVRVVDQDIAQSVAANGSGRHWGGWWSGLQHRWWAAGARTIGRPREGKRVRF